MKYKINFFIFSIEQKLIGYVFSKQKKKSMKTRLFFVMLATWGMLVVSCKKESTSPGSSSLTSQQIDLIENNDTQDAIADKTDQDIDKAINQLQVSNYQTPVTKF